MGLMLLVLWPVLLISAPFQLAGAALSGILGPFGDVAEVWVDYFSNITDIMWM